MSAIVNTLTIIVLVFANGVIMNPLTTMLLTSSYGQPLNPGIIGVIQAFFYILCTGGAIISVYVVIQEAFSRVTYLQDYGNF